MDLILGQDMLAAGWNAHTLNAPGKFLVSAAEHDTPRRARAYLITDKVVAETALRYDDDRPPLDEISRRAVEDNHSPERTATATVPRQVSAEDAPDALLWAALSFAPDDGTTVPDLMEATGMSRPWVYQRLRDLTERGQVRRVGRGHWRAADDAS